MSAENKDPTLEARITELETRLSFQEMTIHELNEVIIAQRDEFDVMTLALEGIKQRLQSLAEHPVLEQSEEAPPPHY